MPTRPAARAQGWPYVRPGSPVTARELGTMRAYLRHDTIKGAAYDLGISETVAKHHLAKLRIRLGVLTNAAAVRELMRRGLLE